MKKVAIITDGLGVGGIEKSLVYNLNSLPEDFNNKLDITVVLLGEDEDLLKEIKVPVTFIRKKDILLGKSYISGLIKKRKIFKAFSVFISLIKLKYNRNDSKKYYKLLSDCTEILNKEYDLAISYALPTSFPLFFTLNNVVAKKKACWVHMNIDDYEKSRILPLFDIYSSFDNIVNVSQYCLEGTKKCFPQTENKLRVVHTSIDKNGIIEKAKCEDSLFSTGNIKLFTCARVSNEKQPLLTIEIVKSLNKSGVKVEWIWAGNGPLIDSVKEEVKRQNLQGQIIFCGNVLNPYPYYKQCDIYVQLSTMESYCLSLAEASILSKNIVSTDFFTAFEILKNNKNASVVKSGSATVSGAIKNIIENGENDSSGFCAVTEEFFNYLCE